jgi:uncharacterized protein YecE (DUF72 family)
MAWPARGLDARRGSWLMAGSRNAGRGRQLNLFGSPESEPPRQRTAVGPAPVQHDLREVAGRLPRNIYLGTSSWSFPGWEGLVYDRSASKTTLARYGLAAYAMHPLLRAVGIDRTFYAPIPAEDFSAYAAGVPDGFRFLVKACGECTTPFKRDAAGKPAGVNELYLDVGYATDEVVGPFAEGLGDKAGPLVFQFPPLEGRITRDPARFAERLNGFLAALPRGPSYAVELRDRDLLCREYVDGLKAAGARHCFNVHPRMPTIPEQRELAEPVSDGPLVVRWMLHAGLGYEEAQRRYEPFSELVDEDEPSRSMLARLCLDHALRGRDAVLVANNKAEGSAPLTVFKLAGEIVRRLDG